MKLIKHDRLRFTLAAACLSLAFLGSAATAAELGPKGEGLPTDAADESNKYLGNLFKDENSGFQVAPPSGSIVITGAGLERMSFVNDQKKWEGDVRVITVKDNPTLAEYSRNMVADFSKTFRAVQVVNTQELQIGKFKALKMAVSMESETVAPSKPGVRPQNQPNVAGPRVNVFRQDLIVQTAPDQMMVMKLYTSLKDRPDAEKTFDAMVKSFEVYDKTELAKRRAAATLLAKKWLADRSADELKSKLNNQPQLFRMKVGGKDVGYSRFDELEKERDGSKGVMVVVSTRVWPPDGTIVSSMNTAYWAYSHEEKGERQGYSVWENATKSDAKGATLPGGKYTFWFKETGQLIDQSNTRLDPATLEKMQKEREDLLRRRDLPADQIPPPIEAIQKQKRVVVSLSGDPTQSVAELSNGSIDVTIPEYRPAILPKILEYTWPRLVDLTKPSEMTFVVYSTYTRKLTLRTLSVKGPEPITLEGKTINAVKCTDEMDTIGTTLWVDATGKILKMLTSDQTILEPTTEDKMQKLWGDKTKSN